MSMSLWAKALVRDLKTGEEKEIEVRTGLVGPVEVTLADALYNRLQEIARESECEPIRFMSPLTTESHNILRMKKRCSCEGSCPACRIGEVDDHRCSKCGRTFCPKCHGIQTGRPNRYVGGCSC